MKKTIILFLFLLFSCTLFYEPVILYEIEPFVDKFIYEGSKRGVHINKDRIKVKFVKFEGAKSGDGENIFGRYRVRFDPRSWVQWEEDHRFYMVCHELGHAALGRRHNDKTEWVDWADTTRFVSIMAKGKLHYTVHPTHDFFNNFYDEYMDELFLRKY